MAVRSSEAVPGVRRAPYLPGSRSVFSPDENLRCYRDALDSGRITAEVAGDLERVDKSLHALGQALGVTQPLGAPGRLAIWWWKVQGVKGVPPRTPVLVRYLERGGVLVPKRVLRNDVKPRLDGPFELNGDLVQTVVSSYWDLFRRREVLVVGWARYRRWFEGVRATSKGLDSICRGAVADAGVVRRTALGRLKAAGYRVPDWIAEASGER